MDTREISAKRLTKTYTLAICIIGVLSILSHFLLEYGLINGRNSALILNTAGRQRMLSQRIAWLSHLYVDGAPVRAELIEAIKKMEDSEKQLGTYKTDDTITAKYFSPSADENTEAEKDLSREVYHYISHARSLVETPPHSRKSQKILDWINEHAHDKILRKLEMNVARHQKDSEERIFSLEILQWGILFIVLMTLTWGLAICRKIVDGFGGKIWLDSAPGEGTCFYFSVPKNIK